VTRDPIVPGNIRDRTGTAGILRRAIAQINRRFAGLRRDVLAIWDGVRTLEVNDASTMVRTIYAMTPEEMAATSQALREALDRWVASEREPAHSFWWSVYDQEASQAGAAQSVANLTRLSPAYGAARSLQQVVFSEAYRNRVAMAQIKSYEHWTGLSAGMRSELSQIIGRAVVDGKNPRAVRTEIAERLGVSRAKAAQYAQTDITDTLRQARIAEAEHAEQEFGLRIGLLWTSALIPTTRPWHASRNGRVYSADQVRVFYGERGNRYNCHCATTECLLDEDGKPILTKRLRETMAGELATWSKRTGKP
jgi:uncharacterized protein with gpF-like domain